MKRRDILIAVGGGIVGGSVTGVIGSDDATPAPLPGDGNETDDGTGNETDDGTNETDDGTGNETEAFLDPSIIQTNSPVEIGSQLTVDYSLINTGGSLNNTTDVWIEIGNSEKDRDTDITVQSGGSKTGQLNYTPTTAGSYNISVHTMDAEVSKSVIVERLLPDTTAKRTGDGMSTSLSSKRGVQFKTKDDFAEVGFKISSKTKAFTTSYLYDYKQSQIVEVKDVSDLTGLDTFVISHSYVDGRKYSIVLDNDGTEYTVGLHGDGETPTYQTSDIDLITAVKDTNDTSAGSYQNILSVGNPDGVLD